MNWLESLMYGLVSGFAEFLPVSSQAHQTIFLRLFGGTDNGLLRLFLHVGMLLAVIVSHRSQMLRLHREMRLAQIPRKRRRRNPDPQAMMDLSLLKTAAIVLLFAFLFYPPVSSRKHDLNIVALCLLFNGLILYVPQLLATGNKDARTMSRFDSVLIGLGGALCMLPGVSGIGTMTSVCSMRGADREKALTWSYYLCVPILACLIGFDIQAIIAAGAGNSFGFGVLMMYLLTAAASYLGSLVSITFMRFISVNAGYSGFAFYSWGAALFAFILYLTN